MGARPAAADDGATDAAAEIAAAAGGPVRAADAFVFAEGPVSDWSQRVIPPEVIDLQDWMNRLLSTVLEVPKVLESKSERPNEPETRES